MSFPIVTFFRGRLLQKCSLYLHQIVFFLMHAGICQVLYGFQAGRKIQANARSWFFIYFNCNIISRHKPFEMARNLKLYDVLFQEHSSAYQHPII